MKTKAQITFTAKEFNQISADLSAAKAEISTAKEQLNSLSEAVKLKDQQINFLAQILIALTNIVNSPDFQATLGTGKLWKIIANFGKVLMLVQEIIKLIKVFRDNVKFEQDVNEQGSPAEAVAAN